MTSDATQTDDRKDYLFDTCDTKADLMKACIVYCV